MDPVTLFAVGGAACVRYLHDKGLDAAVGGFIGNRIDAVGCKLLGSFWNNTKNLWSKDELPRNADLLRVLKQAKLDAVSRLVKYTEAVAVELAELDEANKPAREEVKMFASAFYNWYKEELKAIHQSTNPDHHDPLYEKIAWILTAAEGAEVDELRDSLRKTSKDHLIKQIKNDLAIDCLPPLFEDILYNGWREEKDGPVYDWFDSVALMLSHLLKNNKEASEAFHYRLLSDIQIELTLFEKALENSISFKEFIEEKWQQIDRIENRIIDIKEDTADIRQGVKEIITKITPVQYKKNLNNVSTVLQPDFVGREKQLDELYEKINNSRQILLVNGLGGVGKTSLAKQYVALHQHAYNYLLYVEVKLHDDETITPERAVEKLLEAFAADIVLIENLHVNFTPQTGNNTRFLHIINALKNVPAADEKGLLVIDNMPELPADMPVHEMLPGPPHWHCLITSRSKIAGFTLYELDTLSREEAARLFTTHYTGHADAATLDALLTEIGYHTLTTDLLAKTLEQKEGMMSLEEFTDEIKNKHLDDPDLQEKIFTSHHSAGETTVYLHLAKAMSLAEINEEEKWLMKNMAFLLPGYYTAIHLAEWLYVEDAGQKKQLRDIIHSLAKKGWLTHRMKEGYTMHRLVQQLVHYQLEVKYGDVQRLADTLEKKLNPNLTDDYRTVLKTIPFAEWFLEAWPKDIEESEELLFMCNMLSEAYRTKGEFDKSIQLNFRLLDLLAKSDNEDNQNITATVCNNIGVAYHYKGDYAKAINYYEKAMGAGKIFVEKNHTETPTFYNNLGEAHNGIGEHDEAIRYFEMALGLNKASYGEEHDITALCYNNLGTAYQKKGNYDKAIIYYKRALDIFIILYEEANLYVSSVYNNLGSIYDLKAEYDAAIVYHEKALNINKIIYENEHPDVARDYNNLGLVYKNKGEYDRAIDLYNQSLAIVITFYGEEHPETAMRFNNLGLAYDSKGEYEKAIAYFERGIDIYRRFYGEQYITLAILYNNLGTVYLEKADVANAILFFEKALAIDKNHFGEQHPDIAVAFNNLGNAYRGKGDYEQALHYFEKALALHRIFSGEQHPQVATCYNNIGQIANYRGSYEEGIAYFKKALVVYKKFYGDKHPYIATLYNNLGESFRGSSEYDIAIDYYEKALLIYTESYNYEQPEIGILYNNIGLSYCGKGSHEEGIVFFEKALSVFKKFLSPSHPYINATTESLELACKTLSKS